MVKRSGFRQAPDLLEKQIHARCRTLPTTGFGAGGRFPCRNRKAEGRFLQRIGKRPGIPRLAAAILALSLASCEFSRPAATPGAGGPPCWILKFVPWAADGQLTAYFSLADAATNQVAWGGSLRVQVYTSMNVSLGGGATENGGMTLRRPLYDNTFAIGATNFHWEQYGSFFTVRDLAFRFAVPYEVMKGSVRKGKVATVEIAFVPEGATNTLIARRNVFLY